MASGAPWGPLSALPTALLFALALFAWPGRAYGDVVMPQFKLCPWGHSLEHGHGPSYCRPPQPRDCKPGEIPAVVRSRAFCDPPPPKPCPTGSVWRPPYVGGKTCIAKRRCGPSDDPSGTGRCGSGETCRQSSLCERSTFRGRGPPIEVVSGTCRADADCPGPRPPVGRPGRQDSSLFNRCVKAWRCDPAHKRGPDDRTDPGKYLRVRSLADNPDLVIVPVVTVIVAFHLLGVLATFAMILRDRARRRRS